MTSALARTLLAELRTGTQLQVAVVSTYSGWMSRFTLVFSSSWNGRRVATVSDDGT